MFNKLKRILCIMLSAITFIVCFGCDNNGDGGKFDESLIYDEVITPDGTPAYNGAIDVSYLKRTPGGKAYLEVNGSPFLMIGIQVRTDFYMHLEGYTPFQLDKYFQLASTLGVTCLQVPICWKDIEPEKDEYTMEVIEWYIRLCNKYNLKLELLWFGSYMCGYSVEGYVPDYVMNDKKTYPNYLDFTYDGWLGKHWFLRANTPALVERESLAISKMMEGIWEFDRMNGGRRTIIGIQVENEPDMLASRHNEVHGYAHDEIWPDLVAMLDTLGQAVKNSKYRCYTRVNITLDSGYVDRYDDLVATEGIDFVGLDPYTSRISDIATYVKELIAVEGNWAHIAENGASYKNGDQLMLKALQLGAGYEMFDLIVTSEELGDDPSGMFKGDFTKKDHVDEVNEAFTLYRKAYVDIATCETKNFIAFNLLSNGKLQNDNETYSTHSGSVNFSTSSSGLAFAIERDGYLTFASTKDDTFTFTGYTLGDCEIGVYSRTGKWLKQSDTKITNGTITVKGGNVYRVKIA